MKLIDPRSAETVLIYNGGSVPQDVPARDLHGGDLARIAYVRAMTNAAGEVRPDQATPEQLEDLATELSGHGLFSRIAEAQEEPPVEVAVEDLDAHNDPAEDEPAVPESPPTEEPAPPAEPEVAT